MLFNGSRKFEQASLWGKWVLKGRLAGLVKTNCLNPLWEDISIYNNQSRSRYPGLNPE